MVIKNNDEVGQYEFGNIKINIREKKPLTNINVVNHPFDKNLLTI